MLPPAAPPIAWGGATTPCSDSPAVMATPRALLREPLPRPPKTGRDASQESKKPPPAMLVIGTSSNPSAACRTLQVPYPCPPPPMPRIFAWTPCVTLNGECVNAHLGVWGCNPRKVPGPLMQSRCVTRSLHSDLHLLQRSMLSIQSDHLRSNSIQFNK